MDATQLWLQTDHDTLTNQHLVGAAQVSGSAGPSLGARHGSCTHALLEGVVSAAISVSRHVQPLLQPPSIPTGAGAGGLGRPHSHSLGPRGGGAVVEWSSSAHITHSVLLSCGDVSFAM